MAFTNKPDMSIIWASAGTSVQPPNSKIQEGWVAEKPPFQTENWSQQRQDQYLKHIDEHGVPEWGNASEYLIKSLVWYNNNIWESLQSPNVGNVPTDGLGFWSSQSYLDTRGGIMSGRVILQEGIDIELDSGTADSRQVRWIDSGVIRALEDLAISSNIYSLEVRDAGGVIVARLTLTSGSTGLRLNGSTVWTAANHGPGSGLNADLLDGTQLSTIIALINSSGAAFRDVFLVADTYEVPFGATHATFIVQGGGGGGGGGGDGGSSAGSNGIVGQPSSVIFPSGGVSIISSGGNGGGGGGPSDPGLGVGGTVNASTAVQGSTINLRTVYGGETGEVGNVGNPARGGNGGSGLVGLGSVGTTVANTRIGRSGGGGAGGWGQDNAPGGGGASATAISFYLNVTPGTTFNVLIGNGGGGGAGVIASRNGTAGGAGFVSVDYS